MTSIGPTLPDKPAPETETALMDLALAQLEKIFPNVEKEPHLKSEKTPSMVVDLLARSANGRLILFELKSVAPGRMLTYSVYPSVAVLKDAAARITPEFPPVVVLVTNGHVDESVRKLFAQSGIPVVTLGKDVAETRARLRSAFTEFAIDLPEFISKQEIPKARQQFCFVSMPFLPEHKEIYDRAIEPAIRRAGLEPLSPIAISDPGPIFDSIMDVINRSAVVIADITGNNPNVFFEIGIAYSLGKKVILISQDVENIPFYTRSWRILLYQNTRDGADKLKGILAEALVEAEKGQLSQREEQDPKESQKPFDAARVK